MKKNSNRLNINNNLFLFLDIETTGFPIKNQYHKYYPYNDILKYDTSRIVQIAWVICNYNNIIITEKCYKVIPVGFDINNHDIHGITTEDATKQGYHMNFIFEILQNDIKNVKFVICHNLAFDINIIYSEIFRLNKQHLIDELEKKKQFCIGETSKNILKIPLQYNCSLYKMPKLVELYQFCFNKNLPNHHDALSDAKCISQCFFHLIKN